MVNGITRFCFNGSGIHSSPGLVWNNIATLFPDTADSYL